MKLFVIEGIKKEKPDYFEIYYRIFMKDMLYFKESIESDNGLSSIVRRRLIFSGVKMLINSGGKNLNYFPLASALKSMMKFVTPSEFETIFPIEKVFNGKKKGFKDYFFTKNMMRKMGEDQLIGDNIDKFLWDYQNWDINEFLVEMMTSVDELRRSEGKKGMIEEFFEEKGLPTYTLYEDENGKKQLLNNQTQDKVEVKRPIPRYLKVVKDEKSPTSRQED